MNSAKRLVLLFAVCFLVFSEASAAKSKKKPNRG